MTTPAGAPVVDTHEGDTIIRLSWIGTAAYGGCAILTTATAAFVAPLVVVTSVLFVLGLVVFVGAYAVAVGRSREDLIGMGGLFFLAGDTAPARVRRHLMGSLVVQVVLAIATASIGVSRFPADQTNPLAFGFMASLYELALAGWWGARHGSFQPRPPDPPRQPRGRTAAADDQAPDTSPDTAPGTAAAAGRDTGAGAGADRGTGRAAGDDDRDLTS